VKTLALLFSTLAIALAQAPAENPPLPKPDLPRDVEDLFRTAAEALADKDPAGFMGKFDSKMPGYATLRDEVVELLDHSDVGSSWEVVAYQGGEDPMRTLRLDWTLEVNGDQPRRQILKFGIERQGKKWKIVSLEPIEFFKPA
jgi:hypothetical protein